MKIDNIKQDMKIKNYKELCSLLEIEIAGGKSKQLQLKELERYCKYHKEGQKFIIDEVYDEPKEKIDNRGGNNIKYKYLLSPLELSNKFDGFYVYRHILNDEVIYVGKGSKKRATHRRDNYDVYSVDKEIVKRFDDELEALKFEKQLIEYYKSLGQCKYNDDTYHIGLMSSIINAMSKEDKFNVKINKDINNMFKYII